jgi:hypothetical protein
VLCTLAHGIDAIAEPPDDVARVLLSIQRGSHALDVAPDVREPRRVQAHDVCGRRDGLRRRAYGVERHRAHVAQVLRHDHVGRRALERREVDVVHRQRVADDAPHVAIDVAAVGGRRHLRGREHGRAGDARRVIALVRDPDQRALEPQCAHDLGGRRQEARDAR